MEYWIYEDRITRTATVHRADCRYCNNGTGMGRGCNEQQIATHWDIPAEQVVGTGAHN